MIKQAVIAAIQTSIVLSIDQEILHKIMAPDPPFVSPFRRSNVSTPFGRQFDSRINLSGNQARLSFQNSNVNDSDLKR